MLNASNLRAKASKTKFLPITFTAICCYTTNEMNIFTTTQVNHNREQVTVSLAQVSYQVKQVLLC